MTDAALICSTDARISRNGASVQPVTPRRGIARTVAAVGSKVTHYRDAMRVAATLSSVPNCWRRASIPMADWPVTLPFLRPPSDIETSLKSAAASHSRRLRSLCRSPVSTARVIAFASMGGSSLFAAWAPEFISCRSMVGTSTGSQTA